MIIELHVLQNFAPANLNRDDTNSPKECMFGGYRRARISSQCIKHSMRNYFKKNELVEVDNLGVRTKGLVNEVTAQLVAFGKAEEEARSATIKAIESIGKLKLDKEKTQYLLFLGRKEINGVASVIESNWQLLTTAIGNDKKLDKQFETVGKAVLNALNGGKAIDVALFGRMLADLPDQERDAACQVAHAISTHKVGIEFDYYTAMDDLQPKSESGASMMGTIEFDSACFYRYSNIDYAQLLKNLDGDQELTGKAIRAFIRASVNAIPTGKQNSFAAQNPPSFVFAVVRGSGTWSLTNAFSRPIWVGENGDLVSKSISGLVEYWNKLAKVYGEKDIQSKIAFSLEPSNDFKDLHMVDSLENLIGEINKSLGG
jgi:CRISPR system Cascade subunit CasC